MAQRKTDEGKRPRISVSLNPEDYTWIRSFKGPSESYTVSRIVRAARLAGLTLEESHNGGILEDLRDWLKKKRTRSKAATELMEVLTEYLDR
jgi:hypothetical protein